MSNELDIAPIAARAMRLVNRWSELYAVDSEEFTALRDLLSLLREVKRLRTDRLVAAGVLSAHPVTRGMASQLSEIERLKSEVNLLRGFNRLTLLEQRLSVLEANDGQPFKEAE